MSIKIATLAKQAICLLGLTFLAACLQEDTSIDFNTDPSAVKISAQVGEPLTTRSNPVGDDDRTKFNTDDVIAICNEGTFVNYTLTNRGWMPQPGQYLKWEQPTMTFTAYYPVAAGVTHEDFTVPADQSDLAKISTADYMTAKDELTQNGFNPISLQFKRKMACITVVIGSFGNQYTEQQKVVNQVQIISGASSYLAGDPIGTPQTITPLATGEGGLNSSYTALVVPTPEQKEQIFITLVDGQGNTVSVKGIPALDAGVSYRYTLHVGKDALRVSSVTVTDWATGQPIEGDTENEPK